MDKGVALEIQGNTYFVKFPNVGQMMEIESFKMLFTKNKYVQLSMSDLKMHTFLLDTADAIAYLSILIPELQKDLEIKDWWKLDPFVAKEITRVYRKTFAPWLLPILKDLYNFDEKEVEDEAETK